MRRFGYVLLLGLVTLLVAPRAFSASELKTHTVYPGQTLGGIAKRYNVGIAALCRANGIKRKRPIVPKQRLVIPPPSDKDGRNTAALARELKKSAKSSKDTGALKRGKKAAEAKAKARKKAARAERETEKARAKQKTAQQAKNRAEKARAKRKAAQRAKRRAEKARAKRKADQLAQRKAKRHAAKKRQRAATAKRAKRKAARLAKKKRAKRKAARLAKKKRNAKRKAAARKSPKYAKRPKRKGFLRLRGTGASWKGLAVDRKGRVRKKAEAGVAKALASWRTGKREHINRRLIRMLVRVSDHFGGRPIRVVSGYRPYRQGQYTPHSRHNEGRAVDFFVPGVPNEVVRDFCRKLPNVGVGYYPNSTFVHLDVRGVRTYWIDYSGPGEAPRYANGSGKEPKKTKARPKAKAVPKVEAKPDPAQSESEDVPPAKRGARQDKPQPNRG